MDTDPIDEEYKFIFQQPNSADPSVWV